MATKTVIKPKVSKKPKTPVTKTQVESGLKIPVYNLKGEAQTEAVFPKKLQVKVDPMLVAQAYRVHRTNVREGSQSTKTRGEVEGSSRKIYRQKGTGRARHGSIRAPIFVGGGIVFGPRPRNFEAKLTKKMRQRVLTGMLNDKINEKKFMVIAGTVAITGKTKEVIGLFEKLNVRGKKNLLVVDPSLKKLITAARNIPDVTMKSLNNLSGVDLITHENLLMVKESFDKLIETSGKR